MKFVFEERASDSTYVEKIWRTHSDRAGSFTSLAVSHWEMVITTCSGKTTMTVRGPETKATLAECPADAEFFGIQFKLGTFMPHLPISSLVDGAVTLPAATKRSFWLHGAAWQFPDYENVDTFVDRLARQGLLAHDPVVNAIVAGQEPALSLRAMQYRFVRATGLTQRAVRQIERARHAADLIERGASIHDTLYDAGYFDQAHMTRSLKRLVGQTPAQIARSS
jgi:AraC-like DNA-binding protein